MMWQIKNPELKQSKLDFSSSGQDKRPVWQLFSADGIKLINALELEPVSFVSSRRSNSVSEPFDSHLVMWHFIRFRSKVTG